MELVKAAEASPAIVYLMPEQPVSEARTGGAMVVQKVIAGLTDAGVKVRVVTLEELSPGARRNPLVANWMLVRLLLKRGRDSEVLLEDGYMAPWLFAFNWVAKLLFRRKIAIHLQLLEHLHLRRGLRRLVMKLVYCLFLYPADIIVVHSRYMAREAGSLTPGKRNSAFRVIYLASAVRGGAEATPHPVHEGLVRLLCVANYEHNGRKGQHLLLEALARLWESAPDVAERINVTFVGSHRDDGRNQAYLKRLAHLVSDRDWSRQVTLLGWQDSQRLEQLYRESDVFVLPSLNEGFGMAVLEGMTFGLPVIAFDVGPLPELVTHGDGGLLVKPGQVSELAEAIRTLVADGELRKLMGERSRARSQEIGLSWDAVREKTTEAILSLVAR